MTRRRPGDTGPSRPGWRVRLALPLACLAALATTARAGTLEVSVELPIPEKIDTRSIRTVLVARFVSSDHEAIDPGFEIISLVKREISRGTPLRVLDVEPPNLPEQPVEELINNATFWKYIADEHGADLVVSGLVGFRTRDRSGFIREDVVSPTTGQKVRRTRYAEREEFDLGLRLWFFQGANGALLYEDTFRGKQIHEGKSTDPLQVFFELYELVGPDVLGVLVPQKRKDPRTIFTH